MSVARMMATEAHTPTRAGRCQALPIRPTRDFAEDHHHGQIMTRPLDVRNGRRPSAGRRYTRRRAHDL
jgi:hypothetical protein